MSGEVHSLGDAREARINRDSALAKRLVVQADRSVDQIISALNIGNTEIRDPEQLKALIEAVKYMIYERLLDKVLDIEVERDLDKVILSDDEE